MKTKAVIIYHALVIMLILGATIYGRDLRINHLNRDLTETKAEAEKYEQLYKNPGTLFTKNVKGNKGKGKFTTAYADAQRDISIYDQHNSSGIEKFLSDVENDPTDINASVKVTRKDVRGNGMDKYAFFKGIEQQKGFLSPAQANNLLSKKLDWFIENKNIAGPNGWTAVVVPVQNEAGERYVLLVNKMFRDSEKLYVERHTLESVRGWDISANILLPV
ncbi:MAG: hypothetical protein KBC98_02520 [Candidatus Pacebacteria bacterium]|nr:hypothetical protein [Candidatus Paceibacterota bacterium]